MLIKVALAVAFALQGILSLVAARDRYVPVWMAVLGPLLLFVALIQPFRAVTESSTPEAVRDVYVQAGPVGWAFVAMGVLSYVGGVWPLFGERRGEGSMALAQVGGWCVAFGLFWTAYLAHYGALWSFWGAEAPVVADAHRKAWLWFKPWGIASLGAIGVLVLPALLAGALRPKARAVAEAAAALLMVAAVVVWVHPLVRSVRNVEAEWGDACDLIALAGVSLPQGTEPMGTRALVRTGPEGLEVWAGAWMPYSPTGADSVALLAAGTDTIGDLTRQIERLPEKTDVILAGIGAPIATEDSPPLFRTHPVIRAAWCRGHAWPLFGARPHMSVDRALEEAKARVRKWEQ